MKASALIEALALEFGENPQDGDIVAALLGMVQDVIHDITISGEWKHTRKVYQFQTDAGVNTPNLANDVGEIIAIQRNDTGRPLQYVSLERLTDGQLILSDQGEPAFWHFSAYDADTAGLRLYPTPDASYTYDVFYETSSTEITTEDDNLPLPQDFVPVLKHGIRVMYYSQAGEPAQVQLYENRYQRGLQLMRSRQEHVRADKQSTTYNDIDDQTQWPTPQLGTYYPRIG
jgi:hypothetical protein